MILATQRVILRARRKLSFEVIALQGMNALQNTFIIPGGKGGGGIDLQQFLVQGLQTFPTHFI